MEMNPYMGSLSIFNLLIWLTQLENFNKDINSVLIRAQQLCFNEVCKVFNDN